MDKKTGPSAFWILFFSFLLLVPHAFGFWNFLLRHPGSLGAETLLSLGRNAWDAGLALLLLSGFYGWGSLVLRKCAPSFESEPAGIRSALAILACESFFSSALLALGLAGGFQTWAFLCLWAMVLAGFFLALKEGIYACKRRDLPRLNLSWPLIFLGSLTGAALLRAAVATGAPPTDWDSLAYHLAFPKIFLSREGLIRLPWSINAHYPLGTEMIYTLSLFLRGGEAAQWINFFHGALFLVLVFSCARRFFSREAAWISVALLAIQPLFQRVIGNAETDFPVALFSMLALYALIRGGEKEEDSLFWHLASGAFSGMAMSAKLTGTWTALTLFVFMSAGIAVRFFKNGPDKARTASLKPAGVWLAAAALFGCPWYLKNWIWTGNPVWPYLGEWFGAGAVDLAAWERIRASVTEGIEKNVWNWLSLPVRLVFDPRPFQYEPQYLAAPFLLFAAWKTARGVFSSAEKKLLSVLFLFASLWFVLYQSWRYFLPLAGWMAILTAHWSREAFREKRGRPWIYLAALFCLVPFKDLSVNNEWFAVLAPRSAERPGVSARDRYLEWSLGPAYLLCVKANETLPQNAKALFYRDVRGYYLDRDYAWGDPLNPGVVSYAGLKDSEELFRALRRQGFTHVIYNPYVGGYRGDGNYYARADRLMAGVLKNHAVLLYETGGQGLFELSPR